MGHLGLEDEPRVGQSPSRRAWRRFRRNKLAIGGLFFLALVSVLSILAPWLAQDPNAVDLSVVLQPPSSEHWLGTDQAGRDVLARVLYGGRVSLLIGFASAISTVFIGLVFGTIAGYRGGVFDWIFMRLVEVVLSFPTLVLIIFFVTRFGRNGDHHRPGYGSLPMADFWTPGAEHDRRNQRTRIRSGCSSIRSARSSHDRPTFDTRRNRTANSGRHTSCGTGDSDRISVVIPRFRPFASPLPVGEAF